MADLFKYSDKCDKKNRREQQIEENAKDVFEKSKEELYDQQEDRSLVNSPKRKKSKKKKHEKKRKKHKKYKECHSSDRNDSSSEEEEEWIEATPSVPSAEKIKREDWMSSPFMFVPTVSKKELRKRERNEEESERHTKSLSTLNKPGQHERELNPYWKDGGTGLPSNTESRTIPDLPSESFADGGLSWLKKAYQRVKDRAEEEHRSIEEVAAERWGSLENLESLLGEAKERDHRSKHAGYKFKKKKSRSTVHQEKSALLWEENCNERYKEIKIQSKASDNNSSLTASTKYKEMFHKPSESNSTPAKSFNSRLDQPKSRRSWMKKEYINQVSQSTSKGISDSKSPTTHPDPKMPPSSRIQQQPLLEDGPRLTLLSDKEMNALGAKILKAELLGDNETAATLKAKLDNARKAKETFLQQEKKDDSNEDIVILTQTDSKGLCRPIPEPENVSSNLKQKRHKVASHDASGARVSYFPDDGKYSLKQMFEREKFTTANDQNSMFLELAGKAKLCKNDDYDVDDMFIDKATRKGSNYKTDEQERSRAIYEYKHLKSAMEKCPYCLDGSQMKKHLIIAFGTKTCLYLPPYQSLTKGHCLIVPLRHLSAATLLDDDEWREVQDFRKNLTKMFQDRGDDLLFMETSMHLRKHPHTVIECIPLPKEIGDTAPIFFKKAILECDTEWAINKKLIDISAKGIQHSVPSGLPYFSVDFGCQNGFAHVIEDERLFPSYFGKEIIGGMLDLEPYLWRKPRFENFDDQRKKALEFEEWWKPYNWTQDVNKQ